MKKTLLLFFAGAIIGCSEGKKIIEKEDIMGQWKEVQVKKTRKTLVMDVTDCENKGGGDIYTFNADGSYTTKNFCTGEMDSEGNTWTYEDNILDLKDKDSEGNLFEVRYSVSDNGNNQLKLSLVFNQYNGHCPVDMYGYYVVLDKQ